MKDYKVICWGDRGYDIGILSFKWCYFVVIIGYFVYGCVLKILLFSMVFNGVS